MDETLSFNKNIQLCYCSGEIFVSEETIFHSTHMTDIFAVGHTKRYQISSLVTILFKNSIYCNKYHGCVVVV
jgi:hypothetical protein